MKQLSLTNEIVPAYYKLLENKSRYLVLYGGGGSGKSYFAGQKTIVRIIMEKGHRHLVLRKVAKTIRPSVFTLLKEIIAGWDVSSYFEVNSTEMKFKYIGAGNGHGNEILTAGLDDVEKIKSIQGITSIWIEEATELTREDFLQLNIRLRGITPHYKQIMLSFNPISNQNWLYNHFFSKPDAHTQSNCTIVQTTYRDNTKLDEEYKHILESLAEQDENYYNVYAKGLWGQLAEMIYKPFEIINKYPVFFDETIYGMDFGFVNPTALVRVDIKDGVYYVTEELYQSKLTNSDLIEILKTKNINRTSPIYCDHAEPQRIEELIRAGFYCLSADKSVKDGIDKVKRAKIYSTPDNTNINTEVLGYSYKKDKNGTLLEEPIKFKDHALDALRYAIHSHTKFADNYAVGKDIEKMDDTNLLRFAEAFMEEKYRIWTKYEHQPEVDKEGELKQVMGLTDGEYKKLKDYVRDAYGY